MAEQLTPLHVPLTCQDVIDSGWLRRTRNAILADGYAIRAGANFTVEAQVINHPAEWRSIMLSNCGCRFVDAQELALVMAMLEGRTPIPDPPAPQ